jgi:hypothetical protein
LSVEKAFTYADLYAMLENGDTVAWLTVPGNRQSSQSIRLRTKDHP